MSSLRDLVAAITPRFFREPTTAASQTVAAPRGEQAVADTTRLFGGAAPTLVYNPDEIVGRYGYRRLEEMCNDDQIKAALAFKQHAALATGWAIKSAEGEDDDWEPRVFVERTLLALEGTLEETLLRIMTALAYGHSLTEKIWGERDGAVTLVALKTRHPNDIYFIQDKHGNVTGIKQWGNDLTPDKYIRFAYDSVFDNPYGRSDLRAAYRAWWAKVNAYNWLAMLLERLGIPPIFALYNPDQFKREEPTRIAEVLKRMRAATTAAIPRPDKEALELWSTQIKGEVSQVFVPALQMYNTDIARALLMPGLLGATPDAAEGSYARAKTQFDVFMLIVERLRQTLAERVMQEQVVIPLCQVNFGILDEYPRFAFSPLTDEVRLELLATWGELTGQRVVTSSEDDERHVRALLKFPELTPDALAQRKRREEETTELPVTFKQFAQQRLHAAHIDYVAITRALDDAEGALVAELRTSLRASLDELQRIVRRDFNAEAARVAWVERLALRKWGAVQDALREGLRAAVRAGQEAVRREVGIAARYASSITVSPSAAVQAMADKALWVSGVMKDALLKATQEVLVQAIKNGEPLAETMAKIREAWLPYLGDDTIIVDEEQLHPHRLETIVRTNMTDAYNTGRLQSLRDPELDTFVQAVRYSAIIDTRTTPLCEGLDGAVFRRDDPNLDRLTPPNHFNCRSLLVPVMVTERVRAEDWATAQRVGRAFDAMQAGFGGAAKFAWDESQHPRQGAGDEHGGEFAPKGSMTSASGTLNDEQHARLASLKLPPAWRDVQLSVDPRASLQATGIDAKGRKQYVYSAEHSSRMAALKFARLRAFSEEVPRITAKALADMRGGNHDAAALYLIARTGIRVGSDAETGAAVKAYGATTLLGKHVTVVGDTVRLSFVGKKGVHIDKTVDDVALARFMRERRAGGAERVFDTTDARVRDYLKRAGGRDEFKVKDFRTWHGTAKALELIGAELRSGRAPRNAKERAAVVTRVKKGVAAHLGNTPAVAFASYIDPAVWGRVQ